MAKGIDWGVQATQRIRRLEMLHAVSCLERASLVMKDELTPDINRLLETALDVTEMVERQFRKPVTKSDQLSP